MIYSTVTAVHTSDIKSYVMVNGFLKSALTCT